MYAGYSREQFVGYLLGALVEQQGGVVQIDKIALDKFIKDEFYAVKVDTEGDYITLEVLDEDPTAKQVGKDPNKS